MPQTAPPPPIDYGQKAKDKFVALQQSYGALFPRKIDPKNDPRNYWKFGNAFDTMIDYLIFISADDAQKVADMVTNQYAASLKALGGYDAAWFDDFGWWTIAATRWVQAQMPTFPDISKFKKIRDDCWSRFTGNAPFVWDRHKDGTFSEYQPAVDHGVWNSYWQGTSPNWKGPKSGDPTGGLQGIQNNVTNCVYLISAERIPAKDAAEYEFQFLYEWLTKQSPPLWWAEKNLVRERVSHFDEKVNQDPAPDFQLDWAWTGDQGLMLGAIVDRIRLMGPSSDLLTYAENILSGVKQNLVDGLLLRPYTASGNVPDGDTKDYITGLGVFWRYLLHAWSFNEDLKAKINQPEYTAFLKANAEAAANRPTTGFDDITDAFDDLTNDLAVLVAAYWILK